jgi:hypothetical protein
MDASNRPPRSPGKHRDLVQQDRQLLRRLGLDPDLAPLRPLGLGA